MRVLFRDHSQEISIPSHMAKIGMHFIKIQVNRETIIVNYVIDEVVKCKVDLEN